MISVIPIIVLTLENLKVIGCILVARTAGQYIFSVNLRFGSVIWDAIIVTKNIWEVMKQVTKLILIVDIYDRNTIIYKKSESTNKYNHSFFCKTRAIASKIRSRPHAWLLLINY